MESGDQHGRIGSEPRSRRGARAPLFDRLSDFHPAALSEVAPLRVYTQRQLIASVCREISRLLNTRSGLRGAHQLAAQGTVLDYGLPDFTSWIAASGVDRERMEAAIAQRIMAHEPRLREVKVSLEGNPDNPQSLFGVIRAVLQVGKVPDPVRFYIQGQDAEFLVLPEGDADNAGPAGSSSR
ncbi:MAG: type VI secretion system baseplate subunit TssE [Acidobacteria bacterium]|nr:type VI secretion system baseplate subunit TssE [Acidobacteriota bacterium]